MTPKATERLTFRYFNSKDFKLTEALNNDPEVMKYVGGVKNQQELEESFQKYLNYHEQYPGYGYWAAFHKNDKAFVGMYLVKVMDKTSDTEIGYLLRQQYWGQGLASEGARELNQYSIENMESTVLAAITDPENKGSRHVLEKAGFKFVRYGEFKDTTCAYYRMHCDEKRT